MSPVNFEVLAYEESPLGMVCLRQRALRSEPETLVTEITLDHQFLMSSCNTASERALARHALDMHPGKDLAVLVGGLGLGYTAREALRSERVVSVQVVEFLPPVIAWLETGLLPLSDELKADSRLAVIEGDIYARLSAPPERRYDLILVDVDHSPDERLGDENAPFYRKAGLRQAQQHLAPDGVLGVWSYEESLPFAETLRAVFREVRSEPVTFANRVFDEEETNWLYFARG